MAQLFPIRRAAAYRQRAHELAETAKHLRDECDRQHLRDLAATFQRAADQMSPENPDAPQIQAAWSRLLRQPGS